MKLFFSEFKEDYQKYHFPYQVWLLKEKADDVGKIYASGFLPIRSLPDVYYLSRSLRVDLSQFSLSSENRRILKKTENFSAELLPLAQFFYNTEVQKLCRDYAQERLGKGALPVPAIRSVFSGRVYTHVLVFKGEQKPVGYAVCFINDSLLQYAHAFYALAHLNENLGARMILEAVGWAKENKRKYAYLGTCYEEKALYKTEFRGGEFFNGFSWSKNLDELKALIKGFNGEYLLKNKDYLNSFHKGDLLQLLNTYGVRVNY